MPPTRVISLVAAALLPLAAAAQTAPGSIRCESADGKSVIYSNQPCPSGFRLVRPVGLPPTALDAAQTRARVQSEARRSAPTAGQAAEARARAQREADVALALELRRRERALDQDGVSRAAYPQLRQRQSDAIQRAADCGYLQGEIDATRRMRDLLAPRQYYSYEDAEAIRGIIARLSEEYRLLCSP